MARLSCIDDVNLYARALAAKIISKRIASSHALRNKAPSDDRCSHGCDRLTAALQGVHPASRDFVADLRGGRFTELSGEDVVIVGLRQLNDVETELVKMRARNSDQRLGICVLAKVIQVSPTGERDRAVGGRLTQALGNTPPVVIADGGRLNVAVPASLKGPTREDR
jgi:hypothetical protein